MFCCVSLTLFLSQRRECYWTEHFCKIFPVFFSSAFFSLYLCHLELKSFCYFLTSPIWHEYTRFCSVQWNLLSLHGTNVHLYSEREFWNVRWSYFQLKILYWSQMRICRTDSLSSVLPKCYVLALPTEGIIAWLINKFRTSSILLPK